MNPRPHKIALARLSARGEHYEDGAPCADCERVLRACGLGRAVFTTTRGAVATLELDGAAAADRLSDEDSEWMGVPAGWARVASDAPPPAGDAAQ